MAIIRRYFEEGRLELAATEDEEGEFVAARPNVSGWRMSSHDLRDLHVHKF